MRMKPVLCCCLALLNVALVSAAELPDPLRLTNGTRVTTASQWHEQRRPELLELFRTHVYGRAPAGRPDSLKFTLTDVTTNAMDGKATRKLVTVSYRGPGGEGAIRVVLFSPNQPKPAPCFLFICNRSPTNMDPSRVVKSDFWPAEEIIARGYATAAFFNGDVVPDKHDGFRSGAHAIFQSPSARQPDSWGTIAAWAWGASRVMDYLRTEPLIDAQRVAVVGHSRGGKTALWAAAEDERFAMAVSNDSGCTGAAITRGKKGERIRDINRGFPHWFCDNYKRFNDREEELPVDQHELLTLIAPRLVYVASASKDTWADPASEFAAAVHATPVFELLGARGMTQTNMPSINSALHQGRIGYHVRAGKHNLTREDWRHFLDFADQHWRR
jgi:dienelactone hydrolase